ncbi:DUF433 domain-containing protein [candidate division KSB1 bacterium]|nr:DUF433 domain-containing protein [candidate division KSB1 bacterium]
MNKSKIMQKVSPPSLKHSNSMNGRKRSASMRSKSKKLVREMVGGEPYEYYPIGRYVVCAPGICGGRPTFKYTRIDVRHALRLLSEDYTVEGIAKAWRLPVEAVQEALTLATKTFDQHLTVYAKAA